MKEGSLGALRDLVTRSKCRATSLCSIHRKSKKLWIYTHLSPSANKGGFLTRHQGFDVYKLSSNSAANKKTCPQPTISLKEEKSKKKQQKDGKDDSLPLSNVQPTPCA